MSLNDYLFYDVLPRLDGHMELKHNNKKIYVGDIIKYYTNEVNKNNTSGNSK